MKKKEPIEKFVPVKLSLEVKGVERDVIRITHDQFEALARLHSKIIRKGNKVKYEKERAKEHP